MLIDTIERKRLGQMGGLVTSFILTIALESWITSQHCTYSYVFGPVKFDSEVKNIKNGRLGGQRGPE